MTSSSSVEWHRSSYSNGMGGECLEVAALAESVTVRDSKAASGSPQLMFNIPTWRSFIRTLTLGTDEPTS
ncbi:hypothetical protein AQJ23_10230 [Streptomyces antibioticus]|nr:DUF397 domain-containing protein [Streptomyces antibioticus]KUN28255.1 hypothetical protein AQJ23_10230 [Streptomyces antibioticus]